MSKTATASPTGGTSRSSPDLVPLGRGTDFSNHSDPSGSVSYSHMAPRATASCAFDDTHSYSEVDSEEGEEDEKAGEGGPGEKFPVQWQQVSWNGCGSEATEDREDRRDRAVWRGDISDFPSKRCNQLVQSQHKYYHHKTGDSYNMGRM